MSLGGSTAWTGDNIVTGGGATIANSGTFDVSTDSAMTHDATSGTRATFRNEGTFTKSAGAGGAAKTEIQTTFTNTGTVNANAGTLLLSAGGSSTGTLSAASGARLELGGTFTLGGPITGSGTTAILGTSTWTSGDMSGAGTTSVAAGAQLTISSSGDKQLKHGSAGSGGRTLENSGTLTWAGDAADVLLGDGAQIANRAGATFSVQNDRTLGYTGSGDAGTIANAGTFAKSASTGTTTVAQPFTNTGVVDAQSGTIAFTSTLTNQGELRAAHGAANVFSGTQAFADGTTFTGSGANRIAGGTTTFNGAVSSQNLEFAAGSATGTATFSGNTTWSGGDWTGTGTFTFASGTLAIGGSDTKQLLAGTTGSGGRTVSIAGTATWDGSGGIRGGEGAGIQIQSAGTFEVRNDSNFSYAGSGNAPFVSNAGTFRKTTATGTTTISDAVFTNTGTVQVDSGTIRVSGSSGGFNNNGSVSVASGAAFVGAGGTGASSGSFNVSSGGTLQFTGGTQTLNAGAKFLGAGATDIDGATLQIAGATAVGSSSQAGKLRLASGTIGGSGTLTIEAQGSLEWTGGDMAGSGTTVVAAGGTATIAGSADKRLNHGTSGSGGHTLSNFGTITWQDGKILGGDGAQIRNETGGVFDLQADTTLGYSGSGSGLTFTNAGTFRKSAGNGTSTLNQTFNTTGTVQVDLGTLAIAGGGTGSGTFSTGANSTIDFTSDYTVSGAKFLGGGGSRVSGRLVLSGTNDVGSATQASALRLVSGGTVAGSGSLTIVSGSTLDWSGGDMTGGGATTVAAGGQVVLGGSSNKRLFEGTSGSGGRTLNNNGTIAWSGAGSLLAGDGAVINNAGLFDAQTDATLGYTGAGNAPTFNNTGQFRKSGGANSFTVSSGQFNNSGSVEVQSGTVAIAAGGTANGGQFSVGSGAHLVFSGNYSLQGARLNGSGTATLASGTLTVAGGTATQIDGKLEVAASTAIAGDGILDVANELDWLGGDMTGSGTTRVLSAGKIVLSGATDKRVFQGTAGSGGRTLVNSGLVTNEGAGALLFGDGATFTNESTGTFDLQTDAGFAYAGVGNAGTFTNRGVLLKSGGTGTSTVAGVSFTNNNVVRAQSGTIAFNTDVTSNAGTFEAAPGATIQFAGNGARTFGANSSFTGGGSHVIAGGNSTFSGDFNALNLTFAGGTLAGAASMHGSLAWTGGDWIGGSSFTVASGSVLTLDGTDAKRLYHGTAASGGRALVNDGGIVWQGSGNVLLGDGAQITNHANASFEIRNDATLGYTGSGDSGAFVNNGVLTRTTSTGTATIAQPFVQNAGATLVVSAGTLAFTSTFTNNGGSVALSHGAALSFTGGTLGLGTGALTGTGTIHASKVVAGGLVSPGNSPGTLTFTGDLTLLATSTLLIELGGPTQGSDYDFVNVGGAAVVGGSLSLSVLNGYQSAIPSTATFTVLTGSGGLTGAFANVANGQRLLTSDGVSSFQVNYGLGSAFGANSLVLSNFVAVPEPSTWTLLGAGALLVLWSVRRRTR